MIDRPKSPLLDRVKLPADLKALSDRELRQLSDELRAETISAVSVTGGHLGAGLGVVELTVALHAVFDAPRDKIIWDVGHQCYPHKILTGRRDQIRTLRTEGGLSGFTKRSESPYDPFGAAHSSTSISAALGLVMAADLGDDPGDAVAVICDGAMSAGMAFEALNNAGHLKKRLFVVLNDNEMSIAPPVGALSAYLSRIYAGAPYQEFKSAAKGMVSLLPEPLQEGARRATEMLKRMAVGGTLFEELGVSYVGPIDGHDLDQLLPVLRTARARATGPMLIHVITKKGKGYAPAETARDKGHATAKFDVLTGVQAKAASNAPSYTKVFAQALLREAEVDARFVAVTAAMPDGTGLDLFAARFPRRCFDVGIAEQHAVTFSAGLAAGGMKPTVADARFAKPLDREMILSLAAQHEALITIEEGAVGGFGSHVAQLLAEEGVFDRGLKYRSMVLPDIFIDQASPEAMYRVAGMDAAQIEARVLETLGVAVVGLRA